MDAKQARKLKPGTRVAGGADGTLGTIKWSNPTPGRAALCVVSQNLGLLTRFETTRNDQGQIADIIKRAIERREIERQFPANGTVEAYWMWHSPVGWMVDYSQKII
jgi:hypothetical protein